MLCMPSRSPHFSVLRGRLVGVFFEDVVEIGRVCVANLLCNLIQRQRGVPKQRLGALDAQLIEIVGKQLAGLILEKLAEVGCADIEQIGECFQRNVARVFPLERRRRTA